jgi:hypothetical protein
MVLRVEMVDVSHLTSSTGSVLGGPQPNIDVGHTTSEPPLEWMIGVTLLLAMKRRR